jgi:hypothetical protein
MFQKIGNEAMKFLISEFVHESFQRVCYNAKRIIKFSIKSEYDSFNNKIN